MLFFPKLPIIIQENHNAWTILGISVLLNVICFDKLLAKLIFLVLFLYVWNSWLDNSSYSIFFLVILSVLPVWFDDPDFNNLIAYLVKNPFELYSF